MPRLFEISDEFAQLFDEFEELMDYAEENGISSEEAEKAWFETLDAIETQFEIKADSVAQYIKELKAKSDAIKAEELKLKARRTTYENKVERLKLYLKENMEKMNRKKIETARSKILIRNNAPSLSISNEQAFIKMLESKGREELLKRAEPEIRKNDVKNLMKAGEVFDGAELVSTKSIIIS